MALFLMMVLIFGPDFWEQALSPEKVLEYLVAFVRVLIVFLLAWLATALVNRFVSRIRHNIFGAMARRRPESGEFEKRVTTIFMLVRHSAGTLIWVLATITALEQVGFDIGPILAMAGFAGLALSFGSRNLVQDFIAGAFILLENQIRLGDSVRVNGTGGVVEAINLRTVRLRGPDGAVHVFPNGSITTLSNLSNKFSYFLWDLGVPYHEDTDRVMEVVTELAAEMRGEEEWAPLILDDLEVLGVDSFGDSAVFIKMRIKTLPLRQRPVGRELKRRLKRRFDQLGIEIPLPQRTLHLVGGSAADRAAGVRGSVNRELLKEIILEVLQEYRFRSLSHSPQTLELSRANEDS